MSKYIITIQDTCFRAISIQCAAMKEWLFPSKSQQRRSGIAHAINF